MTLAQLISAVTENAASERLGGSHCSADRDRLICCHNKRADGANDQVTVLAKYLRLEAEGVWRADADAQRRDIIVSIGEATLTLTDLNETALTHWSLPAIRRRNPGIRPAIYAPGTDIDETVEIADDEMIDALEKVLKAVRKQGRHPRRLRNMIYSATAAVCMLLGVFWLPGALASYATNIIPHAARNDIGIRLTRHIESLTGAHCSGPTAKAALHRLADRLFGERDISALVVPSALATTQHLPGGTFLIGHKLVEDHESPDVLAGHLLAEDIRRAQNDPFERLLNDAGLGAVLRLLTTGDLPEDVLRSHAETLVVSERDQVSTEALATAFKRAEIKPSAYMATTPLSDIDKATLSDTAKDVSAVPLLTDIEWIALQQICET